MLRIERSSNGEVVFTLSGRMQTEDINQFQQLLVVETRGQPLTFNLRDVTLVNREAVTFSPIAKRTGSRLRIPPHIRNWIDQEKRRNRRRRMRKEIQSEA